MPGGVPEPPAPPLPQVETEPVKRVEKKPAPVPSGPRHRRRGAPVWMHAVPAALLALASAVIPTHRLRHLSVTDALAGR